MSQEFTCVECGLDMIGNGVNTCECFTDSTKKDLDDLMEFVARCDIIKKLNA